MMPSANLDLVRPIFAEWERGDFRSTEWADPEIEYVWPGGSSSRSWKGPPNVGSAAPGTPPMACANLDLGGRV